MEYNDSIKPCGCKKYIYKQNPQGILTYYTEPCGCCEEKVIDPGPNPDL